MHRRTVLGSLAVSLAGCSTGTETTPEPPPDDSDDYELEIEYPNAWAGSMTLTLPGGREIETIDGNGPERVSLPDDLTHIRAHAEKTATSSGVLTVRLLNHGGVLVMASLGEVPGRAGIETSV